MEDYQAMLNIDEEALDLEWLDQARRFMEISGKYADSIFNYDEAKQALELTTAEVDIDIRKNPDKYDLPKLTETIVMGTVKMQEEYKEALSDLNDAKLEMNVLQSAVKSFEQRKVALENLGKLCIAGFFAGPSIPRDLSYERKQQKERGSRVNEKVKKGMTGKKK